MLLSRAGAWLSREYVAVPLFFVVLLLIGLLGVRSVPISTDEPIMNVLASEATGYVAGENAWPEATERRYHGPLMEMAIYWIQYKTFEVSMQAGTGPLTIADLAVIRHAATYLTFLLGVAGFYFLCKRRFGAWPIALLGSLLLVLSPRVFGQTVATSLFVLWLLTVAWRMWAAHPLEYLTFSLPAAAVQGRFELDYWGLSTRLALQRILDRDARSQLVVRASNNITYENARTFFPDRVILKAQSGSNVDYLLQILADMRYTMNNAGPWLILLASLAPHEAGAAERRPNVVLILTDNHGAWTLGCYGNQDIRTPHIDGLAKQGTLFTRCYSSNAVCSPTRATLLTGLIPSQHGVHTYLRAGEPQIGPKAHCTIAEFRSLSTILAQLGYVCGLSGKWHLGDNLRPQMGFSSWVTMPHGHTIEFYDADVIEDGKIRKEPTYLTDFWTDHGVRFIEKNKERPFFLYLAYNGPYGLGKSLLAPARNRHAAYYADKDMKSFPREKVHPWLFNNKEYINNVHAMRRYAAEISGIDDGVGRILDTLKKHKLDENTLVLFTADQGLAGGHSGFWGMGDHTRPLTAYDWTAHVPLIYRQPGRIAADRRSDLLVSNYDVLPTVLEFLELKDKTPTKPPLPGRSYAKVLRGQQLDWDNTVFFEFEFLRSIRTPEWRYIDRFPTGPHELYNVKNDPGERHNLAGEQAQADVRKQLRQRLNDFFARYADPKYDLRRGGKSKAPLLSAPGTR